MKNPVFCPNCGLTVGEQIGGKLLLAATGYAVGGKDPLIAFGVALLGAWLGHIYIDSALRTCPNCWTVIRIAEGLL